MDPEFDPRDDAALEYLMETENEFYNSNDPTVWDDINELDDWDEDLY